ncbi:50S ribosomal protein L25 [Caproiciproducens galactitolivorans]|uniref:50S ribosomal protein L25 n=1 Tax=Caproiciproducens galactitolivorans TaxID=642589 RepID=A0ABT4BQI1_9FIRM|nr:50S ribosomal protein L25 [Caproiciproducens galactitolivorans]MCY1713133.1 50S ribosomal protein L25 [Caproiciproducens galactitolivorans]
MKEIILNAMERNEKTKKVRNEGFVPGVLNGPGAASTSVKFESAALNKIIAKEGPNAKLWVALGDRKEFGFIKEVQKHPVEDRIQHVAIQLVEKDQTVKMKLPVSFLGQSELENRLLQLQVVKAEIEVEGQAALIPNEAVADISEKTSGENVTGVDFKLPSEIKILDSEEEIYAVIKDDKRKFAEAESD